jgi:hypothetical protein
MILFIWYKYNNEYLHNKVYEKFSDKEERKIMFLHFPHTSTFSALHTNQHHFA